MNEDLRCNTHFGILYRPDRYISQHIAEQSLEITRYWTETFTKEYEVSEDLDYLLESASRNNLKYCLIQESGNMIFDHDFYKLLNTFLKNDQWFAIGHLIDKQSIGLHPQTILVNVENWKKIGKPNYGHTAPDVLQELIVPKRSVLNIHDDYTPLWIIPSNVRKKITEYQPGWGWVNAALESGLILKNFTNDMRKYKIFLYPDNTNLWYDMQSMILSSLLAERTKVFFDNTEGISGFEACSDIDNFYVVASGFKPNIILESCGFSDTTNLIYVDYSWNALEFKKWLHKNWDGTDYVEIVRKYVTDLPGLYDTVKFNDVEFHWQQVLDFFKGEDNFVEHWKKINSCQIEYMHIDIVGYQRKFLIDRIDSTKKNAIWWSHAFNTFNSLMLKGKVGSKICYDHWIQDLFQKDPNIVTLSCYDFNQDLLPSLPLRKYYNGSL